MRGHDLRHKDKRNFYLSKLPRNRLSETAMISSLKVHYKYFYSGSPGLVVMRDSCSEGCGFESQHRILDGHLSHLFVIKL